MLPKPVRDRVVVTEVPPKDNYFPARAFLLAGPAGGGRELAQNRNDGPGARVMAARVTTANVQERARLALPTTGLRRVNYANYANYGDSELR
jgi:hypothetical protein